MVDTQDTNGLDFQDSDEGGGSSIFVCVLCDNQFKNEEDLQMHVVIHFQGSEVHSSEDTYVPSDMEAPRNCQKRKRKKKLILQSGSESDDLKDVGLTCRHCGKLYSVKSNRYRHEKMCMKNENKKLYECPICKIPFCRSDNLNTHLQRCTSNSAKNKTPCPVENCNLRFFHKNMLIKHLNLNHPDESSRKSVIKTFSSLEEFINWKESEEEQTFSYFSKRKGCDRNGSMHYYCQHDGKPHHRLKENSRRGLNKKGRIRVGGFCLAKMKVWEEEDMIYLEYFPTHNHPLNPSDVVHHPMKQRVAEFIEQQIAEDVSPSIIYSKLQTMFGQTNSSQLCRLSSITKKSIKERARRQRMAQVGNEEEKDDAKSVFLMVSQKIEKDDSVVLYKPYKCSIVKGPEEINNLPHSEELFLFGMQTKRQAQLMKEYGESVLIIGVTNNTNQYKYKLLTLMVVDANHRGCPVGHLISSSTDFDILKYFFESLQVRNEMIMQYVITDDDPDLTTLLNDSYSENLSVILCQFNVFKNIQNSIKKEVPVDLQESVTNEIKAMFNVKEEVVLNNICENFLVRYEMDYRMSTFISYLKQNYLNRSEMWAACYRNISQTELNTTIHLQSLHSKLEKVYLKHKGKSRLDVLIKTLYDIEEEDHFAREREKSIGFTAFPKDIQERHDLGMTQVSENVIDLLDNMWEVRVKAGIYKSTFVVIRHTDTCQAEKCSLRCTDPQCPNLCSHLYVCNCQDRHPLCKHIHKVHSLLTREEIHPDIEYLDIETTSVEDGLQMVQTVYQIEEIPYQAEELYYQVEEKVLQNVDSNISPKQKETEELYIKVEENVFLNEETALPSEAFLNSYVEQSSEADAELTNHENLLTKIQTNISDLSNFLPDSLEENVPLQTLSHVNTVLSGLVLKLKNNSTKS